MDQDSDLECVGRAKDSSYNPPHTSAVHKKKHKPPEQLKPPPWSPPSACWLDWHQQQLHFRWRLKAQSHVLHHPAKKRAAKKRGVGLYRTWTRNSSCEPWLRHVTWKSNRHYSSMNTHRQRTEARDYTGLLDGGVGITNQPDHQAELKSVMH